MKAWFEVITTPTADTPGTVIGLHFPDKRYLFGQLAEGTQRACTERSHKLASIGDIFVTGRTEWANTGGMIGVILTQADALKSSNEALEEESRRKAERQAAGTQATNKTSKEAAAAATTEVRKQNVTVHGATNLMHTLATARRFVFRTGMPIYLKEYDHASMAKRPALRQDDPFEKPTFIDSNIKVWALPLKPHSSEDRTMNTQSPRKRSLDEYQEIDQQLDQQVQSQLLRQSIVSDMFNSDWKMDTLIETPLPEVKMPAALFVRNPETKDLEPYKGPLPGDKTDLPNIKVLVRKPWPGATITSLPPTSPSKEAVSYIVRSHDIRGKFDPIKAKNLGVPKGADFARLAKGESVQTADGNTVTPEMVLGETRRGKGFAVIDLPGPEYVEELVNRPEWDSPSVTTELKVIIWILGPGVGDHPKLRKFVARLSHVKHTVSSVDHCPNYLAFNSAAGAAVRLARLRGENYPIPVHDNVKVPQDGAGSLSAPGTEDSPFESLRPGLIVDMEPQFGFNTSEVVTPLNTAKTVFQIPRSVEKRMEVIRTRVKKPAFQKQLAAMRRDLPGADAEVTALGTGSSSPSKYRNVSATLLHVPGYGYYLLDCGENTLGQIRRVYGHAKTQEILRNLRMIWISHLHADHHLGTASLIRAWHEENYGTTEAQSTEAEPDVSKVLQGKRLAIVSDEMMIAWLEEYAAVENFGFDKLIPLCAHPDPAGPSIRTRFTYRHRRNGEGPYGDQSLTGRTVLDFHDEESPLTPLLKSALGVEDILTTRVKHCKGALAVSIVFSDGFKVSYSGDCRPSDKFASIGKGSTLLIHEATFQNDMVGSALAKRHSTAAEALEVGRRMGARSIFLTHFSQRYQKIALVDQNAGTCKHDSATASSPAEKTVVVPGPAKEANDPDIPFDEPEENQASLQSAAHLLDDIHFPLPHRPGLPRSDLVPGRDIPIAAAMDYMRVKVGDLALAQAYAPAVERLVELLERDVLQQTEANKKIIREAELARKAQKNKKFASKKGASGAAAAGGAAVAAVAVGQEEEEKKDEPASNAHSIWSASESEEGWDTSDFEE
ncbi:hypothetical protein N7539_002363 [Penicillium diatomitis]|uniref:ribonuclease Z n=1 Tax=Penicillium diatomitis TaxID=2819901 RepID=A0A9X0BYK6_9EURO|nr:uncharacterized protein N7539_002363 [Penicillium diatomitis]KAJ5490796.1 hypothetical protein N7539_002363 [Penicillium diatomitis]